MEAKTLIGWLKANDIHIVGEEHLPFFNDDASIEELVSLQIKPRNEEEFDVITEYLEAADVEFEHPYDIRNDDEVEEEDKEEWENLFDPDSDNCIEVYC